MNKSEMNEYTIWKHMKQRCNTPTNRMYYLYGAKGIKVCDKWLNDFWEFYKDIGPRPSKDHSLDRINGKGNYEPGNVRWATWVEQNRNKPIQHNNTSGVKGVSQTKYGTWHAYISVNKKRIHLGTFKTFDEAVDARKAAEVKHF